MVLNVFKWFGFASLYQAKDSSLQKRYSAIVESYDNILRLLSVTLDHAVEGGAHVYALLTLRLFALMLDHPFLGRRHT